MANLLYWSLRSLLWLLVVALIYFSIASTYGNWWLRIALILAVVFGYSLLDQPLRDMRGRRRAR